MLMTTVMNTITTNMVSLAIWITGLVRPAPMHLA
jgi:hypothetical protein